MTDYGPMFLSRAGEPMETIEWARAYDDTATRTVAIDVDEDIDTMVSTIWNGLVDRLRGNTVYETAVLVKGEIIDMYRWHTEDETVQGHADVCRKVLGREPRPEDGWVEKRIAAG